MLPPRKSWIALFPLLTLAACNTGGPPRDPAIGEAYAGPLALTLHKDIDPKSPPAAVVRHGDRLDIIAQRRRWYKVRTPQGIEGWTDDRELLDTGQMQRLLALAKETADLPSQGAATTFDTLNIHTEPNRLSASFLQVKEGEKFDVIAHRVLPRTALPKRELVPPRPKPEKKSRSKEKASRLPPPPEPQPPAPPTDWIALSKEHAPNPEEGLPPAAMDDWTLIRAANGQSGWVLTSRVYMAIPDEVAQYAEGHRITSYFSIGKTRDGDLEKDIWLWTTSETLGEDHDFDGYRVFTWSLRHHRYETAYIQRRERGFFPVLAKTGEFSVCLENDGGERLRRVYTMNGNAVRPAGALPCPKPPDVTDDTGETAHIVLREAPAAAPGMMDRVKAKVKSLFGK